MTYTADGISCQACNASLTELESDIAAVVTLRDRAVRRLQELSAPQAKFERVRVADFVKAGETLDTEEGVLKALKSLETHLLKLIAAGIKIILE